MCLDAAGEVVRAGRFAEFAIPAQYHELVAESWKRGEPSLYGRFDFSWNGEGEPKLLEYNADTPTALLEASVIQWHWLEETHAKADQFNSLHEKLIERWKAIGSRLPRASTLHFACVRDNAEDLGNVEYLRDTALQAGIDARFIHIEDIGWDEPAQSFVDLDGSGIRALFKLYPWEWMLREAFGAHLERSGIALVEPAWKMILSNKGILPILWELFPEHPNLLPAYFEPGRIAGDSVEKPLYSREGANVTIRTQSGTRHSVGTYGAEGYIHQAYAPLPNFGGGFVVIGSWVVGDAAAGIGIREDSSPITRNTSRFLPHYFQP
jgi:glutathionylspermidine synthase